MDIPTLVAAKAWVSRAVRIAKPGDPDDVQRLLNEVGAAGGGTVIMPAGEYVIEKTILVPSNCRLQGVGPATVLKSGFPQGVVDPLIVSNAGVTAADGYGSASNIVMADFAVDSAANGIGCAHADNVTFERILGIDSHWHIIEVAGCQNATIRDCTLKTQGTESVLQIDNMSSGDGYVIYDGQSGTNAKVDGTVSQHILIDECYIDATGAASGIHMHRTGGNHVKIRDTTVVGGQHGVFIDTNTSWSHITIDGCTFVGQERAVSSLAPSDNHNHHLRISNCILDGITYQGFGIDYWDDVIVEDVHVLGDYSTGIEENRAGASFWGCLRVLISNVIISGHSNKVSRGIRLSNGSHDASVLNCIIENAGTGILIDSTQSPRIWWSGVRFINCDTDVTGSVESWPQSVSE